jgi:RNA-directed DNA polymerase
VVRVHCDEGIAIHIGPEPCGGTREGTHFLIHRKSRRDRKTTKLKEIKEELRRRLHPSIPEQGQWLKRVVAGYVAYHAVPTNIQAPMAFRFHVISLWGRALRRRSQKDGTTWKRILKIVDDYLPKPRILHPWPNQRCAVKHPR